MENITHISYETAKALKEFCPELPEPIGNEYWVISLGWESKPCVCEGKLPKDLLGDYESCPAYQLHDILSKPFCDKFIFKIWNYDGDFIQSPIDFCSCMAREYYNGGLEDVEKELMKAIKEAR